MALEQGDLDTAEGLLAEAADEFATLGDDLWRRRQRHTGRGCGPPRDAGRARDLVEHALSVHRASGTPILLALALVEAAGVQAD